MNSRIRVISLIVLGLLIAAMISRSGDVAWLMLPFVIYLGVGIYQTPARDRLNFRVFRKLDQTRNDGLASVSSIVTLQNDSIQTVCLWLGDMDREDINLTSGVTGKWVLLRAFESTRLDYTFSSSRGNFSWDSVTVRAGDPLNLFSTEMNLPAAGDIQVRPLIRKFKTIPLRPRSTLHSPGSIPARLGGTGTDFYGVREYHAGDSLRSLDWRMTARHPNKFFTKEFEQEEIAEIGLILDARQNTEMHVGRESLFEHDVNATASLAEMFLHQGHRVSLLVFGKRISIVFPGYGKTQLHRVMSCLSRAEVEFDEHISTHLDFLPIRMFPSRSTIIVLSPLASDDRTLYQRLRSNGYQVFLICPDPIDFAGQILAKDKLTGQAVRTARIERRLQLNGISQLQIPVIDWKVNQPLYPLVRNAMTRSRGQGN
jgi:uncharacterized protein (DUF58 family)